jgi:hypothetical protein
MTRLPRVSLLPNAASQRLDVGLNSEFTAWFFRS